MSGASIATTTSSSTSGLSHRSRSSSLPARPDAWTLLSSIAHRDRFRRAPSMQVNADEAHRASLRARLPAASAAVAKRRNASAIFRHVSNCAFDEDGSHETEPVTSA